MTAFTGWPPRAVEFYRQLEAENTRAWWLEHNATYDDAVRAPFDALSELVAEEFGELHARAAAPQEHRRHPLLGAGRLARIEGAAKRITDTWRAASPLNDWLVANVGPSTAPPDSHW